MLEDQSSSLGICGDASPLRDAEIKVSEQIANEGDRIALMQAKITALEERVATYKDKRLRLVSDKLRPNEIESLEDYAVIPLGHRTPGHVHNPPEHPCGVYEHIKKNGKKLGFFVEAAFGQYTGAADCRKYSKQVMFLTKYKGKILKCRHSFTFSIVEQFDGRVPLPTADSLFALVSAGCSKHVTNCLERLSNGKLPKATSAFLKELDRLFSSGACKTTVETDCESELDDDFELPEKKKAAARRRNRKKQRDESSDSEEDRRPVKKFRTKYREKEVRKPSKKHSSDSEEDVKDVKRKSFQQREKQASDGEQSDQGSEPGQQIKHSKSDKQSKPDKQSKSDKQSKPDKQDKASRSDNPSNRNKHSKREAKDKENKRSKQDNFQRDKESDSDRERAWNQSARNRRQKKQKQPEESSVTGGEVSDVAAVSKKNRDDDENRSGSDQEKESRCHSPKKRTESRSSSRSPARVANPLSVTWDTPLESRVHPSVGMKKPRQWPLQTV